MGESVAAGEFAQLIEGLGPFEPRPALALAVSGGADSMALALLADRWVRSLGGASLALIVDHGLRAGSAAEAGLTRDRLVARGIPAEILTLTDLARGPGLAARARAARYAALAEACCRRGILHLLLAHHAADQAETAIIRQRAGSGPDGLACMAALSETKGIRLLRPLLSVPPVRLRAGLRAAGVEWIEDPSNADLTAQRARVRAERGDPDGTGPATRALVASAVAHAARRADSERAVAAELALRARLHPAGFAVLAPGPLAPGALAAVLGMVAGRAYRPSLLRVAALAAAPRSATLAGARLIPAGRLGQHGAYVVVREEAAMAPPAAAADGATWDGRFTLHLPVPLPPNAAFGALGAAAAGVRRQAPGWPAALLRTLPALWVDGFLVAVPHLCYAACSLGYGVRMELRPSYPVTTGAFHGGTVAADMTAA